MADEETQARRDAALRQVQGLVPGRSTLTIGDTFGDYVGTVERAHETERKFAADGSVLIYGDPSLVDLIARGVATIGERA